MEILVITHKYPPSIGGMQKHCFELVNGIKSLNHTVHLIKQGPKIPKLIFFTTVLFRAILALQRNRQIEIIYVNDGLMAFMVTPLLWLTRIPVVVTIHGLDIVFPFRPYTYWVKQCLSKFRVIISISEGTTCLCKQKGIPEHKIFQVTNAVDFPNYSYHHSLDFRRKLGSDLNLDLVNRPFLVSLGRSIPRKGFSWFTEEVMPHLSENVRYLILTPPIKRERFLKRIRNILPESIYRLVVLAGVEEDQLRLKESITRLGMEHQVFCINQYVHHREMILQIIANADLFVMPNLALKGDFEGFGLVALEASSLGTLALASDVDGISSAVIDQQTGILLPSGNAKAWIKEINRLFDDPDEIIRKATIYQENTRKFHKSWREMAQQYIEVFESVIESTSH